MVKRMLRLTGAGTVVPGCVRSQAGPEAGAETVRMITDHRSDHGRSVGSIRAGECRLLVQIEVRAGGSRVLPGF